MAYALITPSRFPTNLGPVVKQPGFTDYPVNRPFRPPTPANTPVKLPNRPLPGWFKPMRPPSIPAFPRSPFMAPGAAIGGRFLSRFIPYVGWALLAYDLWELWNWYRTRYGPPDGWTLKCRDGTKYEAFSNHSAANNCTTGFQVPEGPIDQINVEPYNCNVFGCKWRDLILGRWANAAKTRFDFDEIWYAPAAVPAGQFDYTPPKPKKPLYIPPNRPYSPAEFWPEVDPLSLPPLAPVPTPRPLPPRLPRIPRNPWRSPTESSQRGPSTRTRARNDPRFYPRRPPNKGDKEQKWSTPYAKSILAKIFSYATEVAEGIDCFWDALPKEFRTKNARYDQRLADLYKHFDKIDLNTALYNVAVNFVEDAVVGGLIGAAQKAGLKVGLNPGALSPNSKL